MGDLRPRVRLAGLTEDKLPRLQWDGQTWRCRCGALYQDDGTEFTLLDERDHG